MTIPFSISLLVICFYISNIAFCQDDKNKDVEEFDAIVLTTAFDLPIVRFNLLEDKPGINNEDGKVEFFNSVGAGLAFKYGQIKTYKNEKNEELKEFSNYVGISIGVLFSSSNTDEGKDNIFALTVGVSFLDLKVAYGYEFGDRPEGIRNGFFTIAYGIPLTKLAGKSGYILKNLSKNPAQLDTKFF